MNDEPREPADGQAGDEEPVGTAAEEAAKLLGALADWTRDHAQASTSGLGDAWGDLAGRASEVADEISAHVATGDTECRYCPICRTVHVLRSASPEVREHLTVAAASLAHAAAALLATAVPPATSDGASRGVEHIDLSDGDEDWPGDG